MEDTDRQLGRQKERRSIFLPVIMLLIIGGSCGYAIGSSHALGPNRYESFAFNGVPAESAFDIAIAKALGENNNDTRAQIAVMRQDNAKQLNAQWDQMRNQIDSLNAEVHSLELEVKQLRDLVEHNSVLLPTSGSITTSGSGY
jgi:hypothetical protein